MGEAVKRSRSFSPRTDEERESELVSLAEELAERRLRDGTASNQMVVHFLKLGSEEAKLERDILREQKKLICAKTEQIESAKETQKVYADAIRAMRTYNGYIEDSEDGY